MGCTVTFFPMFPHALRTVLFFRPYESPPPPSVFHTTPRPFLSKVLGALFSPSTFCRLSLPSGLITLGLVFLFSASPVVSSRVGSASLKRFLALLAHESSSLLPLSFLPVLSLNPAVDSATFSLRPKTQYSVFIVSPPTETPFGFPFPCPPPVPMSAQTTSPVPLKISRSTVSSSILPPPIGHSFFSTARLSS